MIEAKENKQKSTEWVTVNDDEYPQSQNVLLVKFYGKPRFQSHCSVLAYLTLFFPARVGQIPSILSTPGNE